MVSPIMKPTGLAAIIRIILALRDDARRVFAILHTR